MEQSQYLIDTNAIIDYLGYKLPTSGMAFMNNVIDAVPRISIVSKIEVLGFNAPEEHCKTLINFISDSFVFDLVPSIVDRSIEIRKAYKTKLPDTIIAANALVYNLVLITRNVSDFKNIEGLQLINPYDI